MWVIYIESDFNYSGLLPRASAGIDSGLSSSEICGKEKFEAIWAIVRKLVVRASDSVMNLPDIEMYAITKSVSMTPFAEVTFRALSDQIGGVSLVNRKKQLAETQLPELRAASLEIAKKAHAQLIDGRGNDLQNVAASIIHLGQKKDSWFRAGRSVRVIYVSDMVHYTTSDETDIAQSFFNMADADSLSRFADVIEGRGVVGNVSLSRLTNGKQAFEVITYPVARCKYETLGRDTQPDWVYLNSQVSRVWRLVFERLGAKTIWDGGDPSRLTVIE